MVESWNYYFGVYVFVVVGCLFCVVDWVGFWVVGCGCYLGDFGVICCVVCFGCYVSCCWYYVIFYWGICCFGCYLCGWCCGGYGGYCCVMGVDGRMGLVLVVLMLIGCIVWSYVG